MIENISKAYTIMQEAYGVFSVLNDEYNASMQKNEKHYEAITPHGAELLPAIIAGIVPKSAIAKQVTFGNIVLVDVTVEKPDDLKEAEEVLINAYNTFIDLCNDAALPFQFKSKKTRRGTSSSGEAGAGKQAEVLSAIRAIDNTAVVNFNGRRVSGTLSTGAHFDYDIYGQSYLDTIRGMMKV